MFQTCPFSPIETEVQLWFPLPSGPIYKWVIFVGCPGDQREINIER